MLKEEVRRSRLRHAAVKVAARGRRASWAATRGEKTLDQLALWHGADKSSAGHDFAVLYERYVQPRRRGLDPALWGVSSNMRRLRRNASHLSHQRKCGALIFVGELL